MRYTGVGATGVSACRHFCFLLAGGLASAQTDSATFQKVCGACHSYTLISDLKSSEEWGETVQYMVDHGAKGSPAQLAAVMRHLTRNFTRTNVNTAPAAEIAVVLDIDAALAEKIVQRRNFKSLAELKKIVPAGKVDARKERIAFQ